MNNMFGNAPIFNQPIGAWKTDKVTDLTYMFYGATVFNQDISSWNVSKVTAADQMVDGANGGNYKCSWLPEGLTGTGCV